MDNDNKVVCLEKDKGAVYPSERYSFSPSKRYPEYPFGEISEDENKVYALFRHCLLDLGLDKDNYGSSAWNPLGGLLKPGQTAVIKPNLVMHENENTELTVNAMECLVTHPSCIRAIADYCIIALTREDGSIDGKIIIADAPMQGCKFDELVKKIHLDTLMEYYSKKLPEGIIELRDLRQYESTFSRSKVLVHKEYTSSKGIVVDIGSNSMHCKSNCNQQYKVSDYEMEETMSHHHGNVHEYEVAETILSADLLINLSKPKTHRLAGITAALKNMVGATYNKATLPHRTAGSKEEGGDAYLHKNWMKDVAEKILISKVRAEDKGQIVMATILRYFYGAFLVAGRTFGKDNYYIGSWYGNDTIWRTLIDLNFVVNYADKNGNLHDSRQRNILYLADMIIAGQRNGPVRPDPKPMGIVCGSFDGGAIDRTICRIMGFDPVRIPYLKAIEDGDTWMKFHEPIIISNHDKYNGQLSEVSFPASWNFKPHDAWRRVLLEKDNGKGR